LSLPFHSSPLEALHANHHPPRYVSAHIPHPAGICAFISLGLPDGLLGIAYPSIRIDFDLPLDALGMLLIAGMIGYNTSSFFSGKLMRWLGLGGLLAASCLTTGLCLLGNTLVPQWWMFVLLGVFSGFGAGAIDAGINTYIASEHGERLMQWLHASFGIGVTLGPIIMTLGLNLFNRWRVGYIVVGVAQILLAICFALTARLWRKSGTAGSSETNPAADKSEIAETTRLLDYKTPLRQTLAQPAVWLSISLFFIYTAWKSSWDTGATPADRIAPDRIPTGRPGNRQFWAFFTVGRVLAGLYAHRVGGNPLLRGSILLALTAPCCCGGTPHHGSALRALPHRFRRRTDLSRAGVWNQQPVSAKHAANTIGMQISAAGFGGSLLSSLAGVLARNISLEVIPSTWSFCWH
jgi:MFS family permease